MSDQSDEPELDDWSPGELFFRDELKLIGKKFHRFQAALTYICWHDMTPKESRELARKALYTEEELNV